MPTTRRECRAALFQLIGDDVLTQEFFSGGGGRDELLGQRQRDGLVSGGRRELARRRRDRVQRLEPA